MSTKSRKNNKSRRLIHKIIGKNKINPTDVAHEDTLKEDQERILEKEKEEKRKIKIYKINREEQDRVIRLFREITEVVMPELPEGDSKKICLDTTSGLLRRQKFQDEFIIMGHNGDSNFIELANETVKILRTKYPKMKFKVDDW